jgi:hypothetical protein
MLTNVDQWGITGESSTQYLLNAVLIDVNSFIVCFLHGVV